MLHLGFDTNAELDVRAVAVTSLRPVEEEAAECDAEAKHFQHSGPNTELDVALRAIQLANVVLLARLDCNA